MESIGEPMEKKNNHLLKSGVYPPGGLPDLIQFSTYHYTGGIFGFQQEIIIRLLEIVVSLKKIETPDRMACMLINPAVQRFEPLIIELAGVRICNPGFLDYLLREISS